jgi:hypothetical protein
MLRLNQRVVVSDITLALEREAGIFLISAPSGETLQIRLEQGKVEVYRSTYLPEATRNDQLWTIIKVGELE